MAGDQKGVEPRKKRPVEGIDAADDEKEEKFSGVKMMSDLMDEIHAVHTSLIARLRLLSCWSWPDRQKGNGRS